MKQQINASIRTELGVISTLVECRFAKQTCRGELRSRCEAIHDRAASESKRHRHQAQDPHDTANTDPQGMRSAIIGNQRGQRYHPSGSCREDRLNEDGRVRRRSRPACGKTVNSHGGSERLAAL